MKVSVCTLAFGREEHLTNLVNGLKQSERPPGELVIAVMQDTRYQLPSASFPIRQIVMGANAIPLAKARNLAASAASGEFLVFLDVDCIPAPALVGDYVAAAEMADGLLMGEVGYLPKGATCDGIDYAAFDRIAVKHRDRNGPPQDAIGRCRDYRCFWSLNFALKASLFGEIGGFDPRFVGYGGEDTDFGRTIDEHGVDIWWVRGAKAYHQYHPHHMPPVHHINSVLENSMIFREKWGHHTMQHWVRAFVLMGLVERQEDGTFVKLREPDEHDLALTRQQEDEPYASSTVVLEQLEASAKAAAEGATVSPRPTMAVA
ncbi:glycosyltransferase family 2 protein [Aurantiacibacter gangjinensis]|uniref:Glycosyl transferase n=1 Tax=Aurantiacibacter gangjinensis TaxID=502682 RepID=A0A0G9MK58_9SPHN|nr:galactosyltransferase-related protein [Aurantiacibacter gangjinensis]APE29415.1 hypothetical protein BMF35_b0160 [Aurantiacibacter gangjinensis]KLE31024.1 glycosyl transferase [Aurantiacibacter gangjinensis]